MDGLLPLFFGFLLSCGVGWGWGGGCDEGGPSQNCALKNVPGEDWFIVFMYHSLYLSRLTAPMSYQLWNEWPQLYTVQGSQSPYRCLHVLTKLNLPSKALQVLIVYIYICITVLTTLANTKNAHGWLQKPLIFPSQRHWMVSHIYWISKSFGHRLRWCLKQTPGSFRSRAAKITVPRLHDNFRVSHLVAKFKLCKNLS